MNGHNFQTSCEKLEEKLNQKNYNNFQRKKELLFKILIVGDVGVGKTSIINRYTEGRFSTAYRVTIGADFALKTIELDENTQIKAQFWDIAGYERFGSMTSVYYRFANAAAVVFDLTRPQTFNSVEMWLKDIRQRLKVPNGESFPIILLANKGDANISGIPPNIEQFCVQNRIQQWYITSAKNDKNIDTAFENLVQLILQNLEKIGDVSFVTDEDHVLLANIKQNDRSTRCCNILT